MDDEIKLAMRSETSMHQLLENLEPIVYRMSYHLVQNQHDAEDIAQEVLLKVCRNLHKFQFESSFQTWVYAIVLNTTRDHFKKRIPQPIDLHTYTGPNHKSESFEARLDTRIDVQQVLEKLSLRDRQLLVLRFYSEMSVKEISRLMRMSESHVKVTLYRLRQKLRSDYVEGGTAL